MQTAGEQSGNGDDATAASRDRVEGKRPGSAIARFDTGRVARRMPRHAIQSGRTPRSTDADDGCTRFRPLFWTRLRNLPTNTRRIRRHRFRQFRQPSGAIFDSRPPTRSPSPGSRLTSPVPRAERAATPTRRPRVSQGTVTRSDVLFLFRLIQIHHREFIGRDLVRVVDRSVLERGIDRPVCGRSPVVLESPAPHPGSGGSATPDCPRELHADSGEQP